MVVFSGFQVNQMLAGLKNKAVEIPVSLDLGLTKSSVRLTGGSIVFPDKQSIPLSVLSKLSKDLSDCFYLESGQVYRIQCFSEASRRFIKLFATGIDSAPTVSVSGVRMHQTKDRNPIEDTLLKVNSIPLSGLVLDSCMGLGYTAIYARKKGAEKVITFEKEPLMLEIARKNPWSSPLFEDDAIELKNGDVSEVVKGFEDNSFDGIIHDPPRLSLAGNLYSKEFYSELYRVLKPGCGLFHYVGNPGGRFRNRKLSLGVKKRLEECGFKNVRENAKAQGLTAFKCSIYPDGLHFLKCNLLGWFYGLFEF